MGTSLLLDNLDQIEAAIGLASYQAGWYATEAEDFRSWALVRLLEDDCRILRRFRGRSSMRTYLAVVVTNLMRDYRNARFGKWRPSAAAVRLGPEAVALDRLINRDHRKVSDAVSILSAREECELSEAELRLLAARVPHRPTRRAVGEGYLEALSSDETADRALWEGERDRAVRSLGSRLADCIQGLDVEDQLILRLRYWQGYSVADIARALGLRQRPLYDRLARCHAKLAAALKRQGVSEEVVHEALSRDQAVG